MKAFISLFIFLFIVFNAQTQTVYVTKTGKKYHNENCRYLKKSKQEITLQKALKLEYEACSVCKPIQTETVSNNNTFKSVDTKPKSTTTTKSNLQTSTQCTGITKSGNRCKRMTKSANNRCYQH